MNALTLARFFIENLKIYTIFPFVMNAVFLYNNKVEVLKKKGR